jgi:hypothetical protein
MAQDQVHLLFRGEFKIDKLIKLCREFSQVIMVIEQNPIEGIKTISYQSACANFSCIFWFAVINNKD